MIGTDWVVSVAAASVAAVVVVAFAVRTLKREPAVSEEDLDQVLAALNRVEARGTPASRADRAAALARILEAQPEPGGSPVRAVPSTGRVRAGRWRWRLSTVADVVKLLRKTVVLVTVMVGMLLPGAADPWSMNSLAESGHRGADVGSTDRP
ncbi:hypothetical protein [Saccharothrix variisporea]|uniref:Uncharacterized protein n=1 Tax=Saccharothrix variisporea TaxID=543527 RepID=A0A495XDB4_9PSEU|nr:hypothetical protein [Saccharothrix variisporea]RKT70613.1 hypothetical protein DFJ66_3883 [Saccharothrix variisporea]